MGISNAESQHDENLYLKRINRTNIYHFIRKSKGISRQKISRDLHLSLPTVISNIKELMQEGLIQEVGYVGNTGGRKARIYGIVDRARTAIGFDLTRNHISAVAVDLQGNIIYNLRIRCAFSYSDAYFRKLGKLVQQLIRDANLDADSVLGVGIGLPGLVTADNSSVFYGEILSITGATRDEFAKYIPFPTLLINDANAAAFAETWENTSINNAYYVMLSNNVGGAIYINKKVYSGDSLRSGEVGHIKIVPEGKQCYCGQKGCFDAYCAATVLSSATDKDLGKFFELLDKGNPRIKRIWDEYLGYLSRAVNTLHTLFDCRVILGGYVGAYMAERMGELQALVADKEPFVHNADYLTPCRYKTEAIAVGAALNYIVQYLDTI